MKIENNNLDIKRLANNWDASGGVVIYHNGECIYRDFFGFADRETKEVINEESTYLLSGTSQALLAYSLLLLDDMKKIKLNDTIDKYIPEYIHANKIKVKHLILGESGLRDYFYGGVMVKLKNDEKHNMLDDRIRMIKEKTLSTKDYSFKDILEIIGKEDLEFEPGDEKGEFSTTELIFSKEIIERTTGMKLIDFEMKYIFEPLNMTKTVKGKNSNTKNYCSFRNSELINVSVDDTATNLFTTTLGDMEKLLIALIGVNRFNIPAQNLYKSVGFREDIVYEEGMQMKMIM